MTGWQGGGGWNPQQDPYGGQGGQQYGQYGSDPYPQPDPYGQQYDPYGQYGADPYGGGYPGYQGGFEPPPPKRSKLPIVLSIVAIVAIVGTVLTIILLNRNSDDPSPTAGPGGSSAPSKPPSSAKGGPPSSGRKVPSGTKKPPSGKDGWATFDFTGGSFQAPGDWKKDTVAKRESGLGVDFAPGAVVGVYDCEGSTYFRGFAATGQTQSKTGAELDLNKTVAEFATAFAKEYYRNPQLDAPAPQPTTVDGTKAATITIKLTVTPTKPACEATGGEVAVIGVPVEQDGKITAVRMLVVVNDLAGGPSTPEGLPDALAEEIIGTLTIK